MPNLGSLVISLLGDTKQFERSMTATQKKVMKMSETLSNMGKKMTMFVTLPIAGIGTAALISAGKMEKHQIAFETMLGSAEKAEDLLKDIEKFSAATPFQLPNLVEGTKRLIAFGTASDDVIDKMRMLGNAAQGDQEILNRLTLAYGKLQAKGRATLEELNMFTEAGVPILQALADTLEVTTEELFDMISQGKVSFDDVDKALRSLTTGSGRFAGMIEKQSKSLLGLFSTVKDNLGMLARSFAEMILPQIKNFLERTLVIVQRIGEMDDKTKKFILALAGLAAGLGPILFISGKLVRTVTALSAALKLLIPKLVTLGAAAGPVFLAVAALTALGLIIYKNVQANKDLKEAYELLKKPMKDVLDLERLEALQKIQSAALDELRIIKIRNLIQVADGLGGTYEELSAKGKILVEQKEKEIQARHNTIIWLRKEIEAKEKSGDAIDGLVPKIDDETEKIKKEGSIVIEVSDAWTRWADSVRNRTDAAIAGLPVIEDEIKIVLEVSDAWTRWAASIVAAGDAYANLGKTIKDESVKILDAQKGAALEMIGIWQTAVNGVNGIFDQFFMNQNIHLQNWSTKQNDGIDAWYEKEREAIEANITDEEEREQALSDLDEQLQDKKDEHNKAYDKKMRALAYEQAKRDKVAALFQIAINTAMAVSKVWGQTGILGVVAQLLPIAMGIVQAAFVAMRPLPALATGADFITQGPQLVMVGDNPGGQERVQVTPMSSPNINGPKTIIAAPLILQINSTPIYEGMLKATENGIALIHADAVGDF